MSPQDTQMLQDFLSQLVQARGIQKDQEADALIQRAVAQQPDAAYLLVQRALLVGQALENAKSRIATLESQLPQYQSSQYPPQPQYQSAPRSGFLSGGFGSALGSVAATAAGVAAGGFLFQGLENMFHRNEHGEGSQHLLNSDDKSNSLFNDQSGSSLADQAGLGDVDRSADSVQSEGLFDADNTSIDGGEGFFDGDGSDEGLFS
jgi:hypothetical protein